MSAAAQTAVHARPWWPWFKRVATWAFFALVVWLIVDHARGVDWREVRTAVSDLPPSAVITATLLAFCSYALYSTYDLLGRNLTGHALRTGTVMGVTFISYAFNLNLGSLVGGIAFRYRLYSRLGLNNDTITRILGFSMLTNWLGYLVAAGAVFSFWPMSLPAGWKIDSGGLRIVGATLLAAALGYLAVCAVAAGRSWRLRGHELVVPSLRMALLQIAMAVGNWSLMGGIVWVLLQGKIAYPQVLAVLFVAAIAGVITHVPAALGVLEAVFLALLGNELSQGRLLGALLAYRALYYLLPLAIASVFFLVTEVRARHARGGALT